MLQADHDALLTNMPHDRIAAIFSDEFAGLAIASAKNQ
jgi:hypothetical protein